MTKDYSGVCKQIQRWFYRWNVRPLIHWRYEINIRCVCVFTLRKSTEYILSRAGHDFAPSICQCQANSRTQSLFVESFWKLIQQFKKEMTPCQRSSHFNLFLEYLTWHSSFELPCLNTSVSELNVSSSMYLLCAFMVLVSLLPCRPAAEAPNKCAVIYITTPSDVSWGWN